MQSVYWEFLEGVSFFGFVLQGCGLQPARAPSSKVTADMSGFHVDANGNNFIEEGGRVVYITVDECGRPMRPPIQAGHVRPGSIVMIKGSRPCRVTKMEITESKTSKAKKAHDHAQDVQWFKAQDVPYRAQAT